MGIFQADKTYVFLSYIEATTLQPRPDYDTLRLEVPSWVIAGRSGFGGAPAV
jgi:hypothetical protein